MQKSSGLYGLITVNPLLGEETPYHYEDREIILSDWYHDSAYEHAVKLSSKIIFILLTTVIPNVEPQV